LNINHSTFEHTDLGSSFDYTVVAYNFRASQEMQISFVIYINSLLTSIPLLMQPNCDQLIAYRQIKQHSNPFAAGLFSNQIVSVTSVEYNGLYVISTDLF
jgi:hypothetical protein